MHFSIRSMAVIVTALSSLLIQVSADDCTPNDDIIVPVHLVNPLPVPGGPFCAAHWSKGLIVNGINAWGDGYRITGIQLRYSDNSLGPVIGMTYGDPITKTWDSTKVRVTKLNTMGPYQIPGVGRVTFEFSDGSSYTYGGNTGSYQGTSVDVGSGILLGAVGASGNWVDNIGFLFLTDEVASVALTEVVYDTNIATLNAQQSGITNQSVFDIYYTNTGTTARTFLFQPSTTMQETDSNQLTQGSETTWGINGGITFDVAFKAPKVELVTAKPTLNGNRQWTTIQQNQKTWQTQSTAALTWNLGGSVQPNMAVHCSATALNGVFDSSYTSTVVATLTSGKSFTYTERGHYNGASWSQAVANCPDVPLSSVPGGAKISELHSKRLVSFTA